MISALFWDITQFRVVIPQTIGPIFKGQEVLEDVTDWLSRNVCTELPLRLCNIPKERRSQIVPFVIHTREISQSAAFVEIFVMFETILSRVLENLKTWRLSDFLNNNNNK